MIFALDSNMARSYFILCILLFPCLKGQSQENLDELIHLEFELGIGYAHSATQNYFNDSQGTIPGGGVGINMAFRYHFNYKWSAGAHFLITADEIGTYDPDLVLGYYSESPLSISNVNLGFNGKYTYNDLQRWQPYAFGGLGVVFGGITSLEYEEQVNGFTGFAMNMGVGLGYMVNNYVMLSGSVLRNYGLAWLSRMPSAAAVNNQFNPGFWTLSLNVSIFLQDEFY